MQIDDSDAIPAKLSVQLPNALYFSHSNAARHRQHPTHLLYTPNDCHLRLLRRKPPGRGGRP